MSEMTAINLDPEELPRHVVEKSDLGGRWENFGFLKKWERERSWTFPQHAALNVEATHRATLSCRTYSCLRMTQWGPWIPHRWIPVQLSLKRKQRALFLSLSKSKGEKGTETVPASSWFDGHLIFQSTIPRGRTWRNSVKPVFDETSTIQPVGLFEKKNKTRAASLIVRPPPVFKILKYLPFLFSSSPSSIRIPQDGEKTPLEIVNKPATHTKIKQKETWTIPLSLHGFITRCKLKTKEERNDTTELILLKAFISGFFIPQP